ncbi:transposable element Tcb1 transposase [Trichonephila clavipes]|nr:transposable element Tcb1 transposase [Trichonephila clavipes]
MFTVLMPPRNHHWYERKHSGSSFLLKCGRASQTALSRLKLGHIESLSFCGGRKTFALCTKCNTQQASPDHILDCLILSREDLFSSPLLVLDFLREDTTDQRGRSHPPQCTNSREGRQIVRMAVTDRAVISRTVTQHIESVTLHSKSVRTIRRHLLQSGLSARRPLLELPLTQNHRRLHRQ